MNKRRIGYTQGTYDLFHVGHLNLLENAKQQCDYLIVGINSDDLVKDYKNKIVNIHDEDRARIISALKVVDEVHVVDTLDKKEILKLYDFDVIFIGDDWKGNPRWKKTEMEMNELGKELIYLPHTNGVSTTMINLYVSKGNDYGKPIKGIIS